jgi:hypothetical protein
MYVYSILSHLATLSVFETRDFYSSAFSITPSLQYSNTPLPVVVHEHFEAVGNTDVG